MYELIYAKAVIWLIMRFFKLTISALTVFSANSLREKWEKCGSRIKSDNRISTKAYSKAATQLRVSRIIHRRYSVNEILSIVLTVFSANSLSTKGEKCNGWKNPTTYSKPFIS